MKSRIWLAVLFLFGWSRTGSAQNNFNNRVRLLALGLCVTLAMAPAMAAQETGKPLTNQDVIDMVKSGLQESTVVAAIQANPTNLDVSAPALIKLNKAGVSQKILDTMLAAESRKRNPPATPTPAASATMPSPFGGATAGINLFSTSSGPQPSVTLIQGSARQTLTPEKTQLAGTKTKASSLSALSRDNLLNQGLQSGVSTATWEGMMHTNSILGSSAMSQAGGIFGGIMMHHKETLTYVWALPGPSSSYVSPTNAPSFNVNFAGIRGVNSDEYEPAIVKLSLTPNSWRLVGATQGKQDEMSNPALDWPIYSSFVEDRVPVQSSKLASGDWQISPTSPLPEGQYGVVLRPLNRGKKFSGQSVGQNQGDGLLFDSVWAFAVGTPAASGR